MMVMVGARAPQRAARPRAAVAMGALAFTLSVAGCAGQTSEPPPAASLAAARADAMDQDARQPGTYSLDRERLQRLWAQRTADGSGNDFALGPGDVLEISVPLEQLEHREVRISPRDTITLPLVGVMEVGGMTEQGLTEALRTRLAKYMHNPPVSLFVKRYGSREVAVVGAVEKPGLYTLTSGSDTLMEMISKAGGATKDAADNVVFVPAESNRAGLRPASLIAPASPAPDDVSPAMAGAIAPAESEGHEHVAASGEVGPVAPLAARSEARRTGDPAAAALAGLHPIVISMADPREQTYLEMPARPGDVLLVPAAGEVTVGGWVKTPGAYQITPGMTALSAISAAGGAMFSSTAEVLRTGPDGERESIAVDIRQVQRGETSDVALQSGDVVMVDKTALGAIPYAAYEVFDKFGTGMYLPIP
jgi:protein involved in polysaccharide export with SLBB domain